MILHLHPAQKQIAENNSRFRVLLAGRRFGKTVLAIEEMVFIAVSKENAKVVYTAPTFQSARDIALEQLRKRTVEIIKQFNETRLEIEVINKFGGTSKIFLRSWDNIETLRGQAFDFIILDEVAQYRGFWVGWQEVLRPTLTDKRGKALFISTPLGFNHFFDLYNLELTNKDFKSFHFTSYDNPHLEKDEIDKAKQELTEDRFAQEYLADFRKTEGLVFKEFDREKHIYFNEVEGYEKIGGVDFGYTNPAAVMEITIDGKKNYWVNDEWYNTKKTDAEVADYVAIKEFNRVYSDPESPAAIEELRRRKVNIREVQKGKDSIRNGIQVIRELFKSNRLKISSKCVNLINELETYSYPDKKDQRNEDELPIKENDHAIDAIRYALMSVEKSGGNEFTIFKPRWQSFNKRL